MKGSPSKCHVLLGSPTVSPGDLVSTPGVLLHDFEKSIERKKRDCPAFLCTCSFLQPQPHGKSPSFWSKMILQLIHQLP